MSISERSVSQESDLGSIQEQLQGQKGKKFWRSLEELADGEQFKQFVQQEFPSQLEWLNSKLPEASRRNFLKLMAASMAMAGLSGCVPKKPVEKIVPYVKAPEEIIPGKPLFFATALTLGGYATGVLAESHMGRPTKIEGNPDHPASLARPMP